MTAENIVGVVLGPTNPGPLSAGLVRPAIPHDPLQKSMLETCRPSYSQRCWLIMFCAVEHRKPADPLDDSLERVFPLGVSAAVIFLLPESYFYAAQVHGPLMPGQRPAVHRCF